MKDSVARMTAQGIEATDYSRGVERRGAGSAHHQRRQPGADRKSQAAQGQLGTLIQQ
jgi:hypothetical protein